MRMFFMPEVWPESVDEGFWWSQEAARNFPPSARDDRHDTLSSLSVSPNTLF
jgi:hypothetical protein